VTTRLFPADFRFGAATAAYQVEGAWNEDGKGPSIWDRFARLPGKVADGATGEVACDHYHRYPEDVEIMHRLGIRNYRFSVSWPRVVPDGVGPVNQRGLDFYRALVDSLLKNGIEPFVTLYHWDMPDALERAGGWYARATTDRFADFTQAVVRALGDRVTSWITINEPLVIMAEGHVQGITAPGHKSLLRAYRVGHNLLLAHGKSLQRIKALRPGASVGIANHYRPNDPRGPADRRAADVADDYFFRFFMDPIFKRRYPKSVEWMVHLLDRDIRPGDFDLIGAPLDFVGVNHYTRNVVRKGHNPVQPFSFVEPAERGVPVTATGWEIAPAALGRTLRILKEEYGNPVVYVTENGAAYDDVLRDGTVDDSPRIDYLRRYLAEVHDAIAAGARVKGYFVWTLMDNFEWAEGFTKRFGIVHVDFTTLARTVKKSGAWYGELCRTGRLDTDGDGR
jgi:beta-glucosidase